MTDNNQASLLQPLLEFWSQYIEQSKEQTAALLESMREAGDVQSLRRRWLDMLGQSLDTYMRSPVFLDAMRRNAEALTQFKTNTEEAAQECARETGVPRMPDISGLFERMRIGQDLILARLEAIERRLDKLQSRLEKGKP